MLTVTSLVQLPSSHKIHYRTRNKPNKHYRVGITKPSKHYSKEIMQSNQQPADQGGGIQQPADADILCGKSKYCLNHIGSRRYREYLGSYVERYSQATTKYQKMQITKEIYSNLTPTCRFLKHNKRRGLWEEVSPRWL